MKKANASRRSRYVGGNFVGYLKLLGALNLYGLVLGLILKVIEVNASSCSTKAMTIYKR